VISSQDGSWARCRRVANYYDMLGNDAFTKLPASCCRTSRSVHDGIYLSILAMTRATLRRDPDENYAARGDAALTIGLQPAQPQWNTAVGWQRNQYPPTAQRCGRDGKDLYRVQLEHERQHSEQAWSVTARVMRGRGMARTCCPCSISAHPLLPMKRISRSDCAGGRSTRTAT